MSEVIVTCPKCEKKVKLKNSRMLGKKIKCRNCEHPFVLKADSQKPNKPSRRKQAAELESDEEDAYDPELIRNRRLRKRKKGTGSKKSTNESSTKTKASKESNPKLPLPLLVGGIVLGLIVTGGMFYVVFTMGSSLNPGGSAKNKVEVPAKFATFSPEVGDFGCEYPEGWTLKNGGGQGGIQSWATFQSPDESIKISVRGNLAGSAMGSAGVAMSQGVEEVEPPVVDIHRLMKRKISDDYPNYEELGNYKLLKTKMGDTCQSIITSKSMFGGKQKGYRVTFLTGRVQFNMICLCDEGLFEKMRPTFDRVVNTIHEK